MDLTEYEAAKFELADIVRSIPGAEDSGSPEALRTAVRDLFARLAEDRFNLVVAGRFSRGKTTLMNALLGTDRLPTGILPLTSVITSVSYGSRERIQIDCESSAIGFDIPMEALAEYVTERGNPGNVRCIRAARVQLPAEILRRGFHFVDTPGLESAIIENSRTTAAFLPQADAVILVSGYDGPLTDEELRIARSITEAGQPLFFVLNKQDLAAPAARREVEEFVGRRLGEHVADAAARVFSLSALAGLTARLKGEPLGYVLSGVARLEDQLTRFLIEEKHRVLLTGLAQRVRAVLESVDPECREPLLRDRLAQSIRRISHDDVSDRLAGAAVLESTGRIALAAASAAPRVEACPVCARQREALFDFLRRYQFDLARRSGERERLAASAGLCGSHLWLYASIAADRDICVALAPLAERMAAELGRTSADAVAGPTHSHPAGAMRGLEGTLAACVACARQDEAEAAAIDDIAHQFVTGHDVGSLPSVCLPHLRAMARRGVEPALVRALVRRQAGAVARLIEDMHRYVLKRDGARRGLATEEETQAARRVIAFLAGDRSRAN